MTCQRSASSMARRSKFSRMLSIWSR